jgi:hypothetical protein
VQSIKQDVKGMLTGEGIAQLKERLSTIRHVAGGFFDKAQTLQDEGLEHGDIWSDLLTPKLREEGEDLRANIKRISVDIAGAARGSPLIAEADFQDLRHNTRRILSSVRFRQYQYSGRSEFAMKVPRHYLTWNGRRKPVGEI